MPPCEQFSRIRRCREQGDPMSRADRATDVLAGVNPVLEQLRRDARAVHRIHVARGAARGGASRVVEAARIAGIAVVEETNDRLDRLAGGLPHQGVVAEVAPFAYADWRGVVAAGAECLIAADEVTDPRNLGAIIRSADAAGVGGVAIPRHRAAGVTAVVAKAAGGATAGVPVCLVTNVVQALGDAKNAGYW